MEVFDFSKYKKVTKATLLEFHDTSYLNAVLHCFGNIDHMINFFLKPQNKEQIEKNIKKFPLSFVIGRLYQHFYPFPEIDKITYKNDKILCILGTYSNTYKSVNRRNPNELIIFFLNILHKELNANKNININNNFDTYNQDSVIKYGKINFVNNNNSLISDLFTFFEIKLYHCFNCDKVKYEFLSFDAFDLDISGTVKYNGKNNINIKECINFFSKPKLLNFYCSNCKKNCQMEISSKIYCSPNIFIFLLDRGNCDKNLDIYFNLEEKINLNGDDIGYKRCPKEYELIGIVSICLEENKYVAFSKSPIDYQWYMYKDGKEVEQISINDVLKNNNNINRFIPCILFYNSIQNQ